MKDKTFFNLNSIFKSSEGEGIFIGKPQVFVRFQGCKIGCFNCDSKNTWSFQNNKRLNVKEVLQEILELSSGIKGHNLKRVSITGGDPLDEKNRHHTLLLIKELKKENIFVNIEVAGNKLDKEIFDLVDFISFDVKTPSTGVLFSTSLFENFLIHYSHKSQIKSVIETEKDFFFSLDIFKIFENKLSNTPWCITPSYKPNEKLPLKRILDIKKLNESYGGFFQMIGQQHKWFFGPNKDNV